MLRGKCKTALLTYAKNKYKIGTLPMIQDV